jgi:hypothetical protein
MNESDIELLKTSVNKVVRIICRDGEDLLAKVRFVSDQDQEVIYDLVSTTRESQYEKHDEQPAYLINFEDIDRIEPLRKS